MRRPGDAHLCLPGEVRLHGGAARDFLRAGTSGRSFYFPLSCMGNREQCDKKDSCFCVYRTRCWHLPVPLRRLRLPLLPAGHPGRRPVRRGRLRAASGGGRGQQRGQGFEELTKIASPKKKFFITGKKRKRKGEAHSDRGSKGLKTLFANEKFLGFSFRFESALKKKTNSTVEPLDLASICGPLCDALRKRLHGGDAGALRGDRGSIL